LVNYLPKRVKILKQTTLADVAKYAGVTPAAASGFFRGKKKLSKERESKLIEAATQLNYTPMYIRNMSEANSNIKLISMCFIIQNKSEINDFNYLAMMNGIMECLNKNDYQLIMNRNYTLMYKN
jgi:DNA-binding LacI/PurR family transcriptional regulator